MKEFRPALAHLFHRTKPTQTPFATLPFEKPVAESLLRPELNRHLWPPEPPVLLK